MGSSSSHAVSEFIDGARASDAISRVLLLGDSTIDNIVWLGTDREKAFRECVASRLRAYGDSEVGKRLMVNNFSADGFTTTDVLEGRPPLISGQAREGTTDAFPSGATATFRPLEALSEWDYSFGVLSVGGNDIREILGQMHRVEHALRGFTENYPTIVERVRVKCPKLILMLQYRPAFKGPYRVYEAMEVRTVREDKISFYFTHSFVFLR